MSPQTDLAFFQSSVDWVIRDELAGKKPPYNATWQAYWQGRYDLLRGLIMQGHPDGQRYIDYLHRLRRAYNLPLYDSGKPPPEQIYGR